MSKEHLSRGRSCCCNACHACRVSAGLKAAYATGRRPRHAPKWNEWSLEEEDELRALVGSQPVDEIAWRLNQRFHCRRTVAAIRSRALRLGLSTALRALSKTQLCQVFGVGGHLVNLWMQQGLLRPARRHRQYWWFSANAIERFIRGAPWAYDADAMQPGHLRSLAVVQERWLCIKEVALALHITVSMVGHWITAGLIPAQRVTRNRVRIRARDLQAARAAIERAQQDARQHRRALLAASARRAGSELRKAG